MIDMKLVGKYTIDDDFEGFDEDKLFKLTNGQYWLQAEYKYWYYYSYRPTVEILQSGSRYYLRVEGQQQIVAVTPITDVIESNINGQFEGWQGDTQYTLTNGQTWEQIEYKYEYLYSYNPDVIIYQGSGGTTMYVEGTVTRVRRIK